MRKNAAVLAVAVVAGLGGQAVAAQPANPLAKRVTRLEGKVRSHAKGLVQIQARLRSLERGVADLRSQTTIAPVFNVPAPAPGTVTVTVNQALDARLSSLERVVTQIDARVRQLEDHRRRH